LTVHSGNDDALLTSLYGFLSNPDTFEEFLCALETRLDQLEAGGLGVLAGQTISEDPGVSAIEHHFQCAASIFDKIGLQDKKLLSEPDPLGSPVPVLLLDEKATVLAANEAARRELDLPPGASIAGLTTDAATDRSLGQDIRRLITQNGDDLVVTLSDGTDNEGSRKLFTLSKVQEPGGKQVVRLTAIDLAWHERAGDSVGYSFGLTAAEQEILRGIVEGKDIQAIASERGRSLQTVRTQAKSLLRKTGAGSQAGLVRLFAAISISQATATGAKEVHTSPLRVTTDTITLAGGRRLQIDFAGPAGGTPILVMHGLFSGTGLTDETKRFLDTRGLRLIAPWRPGYAGSTPRENGMPADPSAFARDLEEVLDLLGLDQVLVMGRYTGAIYAAAAARLLADRIKACAMVSSTVPIRNKSQLQAMRGWQKLFAYAICYFPATVPVLVRGMNQFLFRKETVKFLEGFYGEPEEDLKIRMHPGIIGIIEEGVASTFCQGTRAHEQDLMLTGSDWSAHLDGIRCPVVFLHGEENPVDPVDQIRNLVSEYTDFALRTFPNEGQLFVHWRPDLVFGTFLEHLETRNRNARTINLADA